MKRFFTPLTVEQGVLESQEDSLIPIGFLTECLNWVPEPTGGLRVRAKWNKGVETSAPATRSNRGIGMFSRFTDPQIVQVVGPVAGTGTSVTPTISWATPTTVGNTIIAIIAVASPTLTTVSVTATGYTARNSITGTTQQQLGLYDILPTTTSYSGDTTPITLTSSSSSSLWEVWFLEVSGLSAFDVSDTDTSSGTSAPLSSSSTTQASAFVIAADAARNSSNTAFTLSTATSDWTEYGEAGQGNAGSGYLEAGWYYGIRRATGAQAITITSSTSVTHGAYLAAYKGWNSDSSPTEKKETWLAANDDGTNIDIMSITRDGLLSGGTWSTADSNVAANTSVPVAFTLGLGRAWYSAAGFTGIRSYDGGSASTVTGSPVGPRCLAIHQTRLWAGGTNGNPSRLYFSQIGSGATWTGRGSSYIDIGTDDGEPLEDITPFGDVLVIGKRTSAWIIAGRTIDEFTAIKLNAGGAAPGRTVLATPYGCVLAGRDQVWLFDGSTVIPIGRGIEQSYGYSAGFLSSSYIDGSIYIADYTAQRIFVFDLVGGTWRTERVGTSQAETAAVLYNYGDTQLMGPYGATEGSLLNYRTFPDPDRGKDYDDLDEAFSAATGDLWLGGPTNPLTLKHLWLQVRQRDGDDTEAAAHLDITYDDTATETTWPIEPEATARVRRERVDVGSSRGKASAKLAFSHTALAGEEVTYDIEAMSIEWDRSEPAGNS